MAIIVGFIKLAEHTLFERCSDDDKKMKNDFAKNEQKKVEKKASNSKVSMELMLITIELILVIYILARRMGRMLFWLESELNSNHSDRNS